MRTDKTRLIEWANSITELFKGVINDKNYANLKAVKTLTNNALGIKIDDITVVEPSDTKQSYFGMMIYNNAIYKKEAIIKLLKGKSVSPELTRGDYHIEIDSRVFDKSLELTPRELTAIFLHEIGHVVFQAEEDMLIKKTISKISMKRGLELGLIINAVTKSNLALNIVTMLMMEVAMISSRNKLSLNIEKLADTFPLQLGYGDDLAKVLEKHSELAMSRIESVYTTGEEAEIVVDYGLKTILNLKHRREELTSAVQQSASSYTGRYIERYVKSVLTTLVRSPKDIYGIVQLVSEAVQEEPLEIVSEGFLEKMFNWKRGVYLENDIDDIKIDIDRIRDNGDKREIISTIHGRLNTARYALDRIEKKGVKPGQDHDVEVARIEGYIRELNDLRDQVHNTKIPSKRYGTFDEFGNIRLPYPEDYKG